METDTKAADVGLFPWAIFDADNTLWDVESLYDHARTEFATLVKERLTLDQSVEDIEEKQNEIDRKLNFAFGYSADRFARSFEETILDYLNERDVHGLDEQTQKLIHKSRGIAAQVFQRRACLYQDTVSALTRARARGYKVAIYTAGERWVQEQRIERSGLRTISDAVEIVDRKTPETLEEFCLKWRVDKAQSYVVGDSLKSDIEPAHALGLRNIRISNPNWNKTEDSDVSPDQEVVRLTDAVKAMRDLGTSGQVADRDTGVRLIFEGGGAKGIAHIGALKVLEGRGYRIERTAGSSAGALVAGLVAAGYTADDMLAIKNGQITDESILKQSLVDRIGKQNWRRIGWFRYLMKPSCGKRFLFRSTTAVIVGLFFLVWYCAPSWLGAYVIALMAMTLAAAIGLWRMSRLSQFGFASLDELERWYNGLLLNSPAFHGQFPSDHEVTFEDFHRNDKEAPVLIASDITNQKLRSLTYGDPGKSTLSAEHREHVQRVNAMAVAEAVVASAALPVVFQPRSFDGGSATQLLVDGGMLSNLPAWSLAEGRERRSTRSPIVAFALTDRDPGEHPPEGFLAFLQGLIKTSISGVRTLETRDIEGLHVINIPTDAEVTAFDMSEKEKIKTYQDGYDAAQKALFDESSAVAWRLVPSEQMKPALKVACDECVETLKRHAQDLLENALPHARDTSPNPVEFPHLRVNIMWVTSTEKLRIAYSFGMETDMDDDLALDREGGNAGLALRRDRSTTVDMRVARDSYTGYRMTKYDQALVRPTLQSLHSVPISGASVSSKLQIDVPIEAVLNFDSDDALVEAFKRDAVAEALERAGHRLVEAWRVFAVGDR